ncbi:MAG: NAD-binding protein [Acidobacteria bacterium]|nr:NAD-binding protein [Acidobacteriota bacterium]
MADDELKKKSLRKRLKKLLQENQWFLWLVGILGVFSFGFWGFYNSLSDKHMWNIFYRILQLFVLNMDYSTIPKIGWQLEVARWLAAFIFGYTAVKALSIIFRERLQLLKIQFFFKKHLIICGLGSKGLLLALKFKKSGHKIVVVESDEENDNIKECLDNGIIVLIGNATSRDYLYKAGVKKAKYLFAVCGHDDVNAEIAVQVRNLLLNKKRTPLTCVVHIIDPHFYYFLKEQEFRFERIDGFRLEFLNLFDGAAQSIIEDDSLSPFAYKRIETAPSPHLLIVGIGNMGESLIIHAVKKWIHLFNKTKEKLIITIIDLEANKKRELLYLRYPGLDEVCQITALEMNIKSAEFEEGLFLFSNANYIDMIYVCLDNNSFALTTALTLRQKLRKFKNPIVVQMTHETGLINLSKNHTNSFDNIYSFGLMDRVLKPGLIDNFTNEMLSRNIHDEYVKERLSEGETGRINSFLVSWDNLPDSIKESNRRQADYIAYKLGAIGCYITPIYDWNAAPVEFTSVEIETMAKIEHNLWMEERLKYGWKFAPGLKNLKKKTSPFLVPWSQLPEEEKEKDRDTVRKIPAYLSKAGFQIYRSKNEQLL